MSRPFSPALVKALIPLHPGEREPVPARPVPQPLRHTRHGRGGGGDALGDLDVRHALLEQADGLPAVCEGLELAARAEVAEEALRLVRRAKRADRDGEIVDPRYLASGGRDDPVSRWSPEHTNMIA